MTRVQTLQDKKVVLEEVKSALQSSLSEIDRKIEAGLVRTLAPLFKQFPEEVIVEIKAGGVYFNMPHPNYTYLKDLFTVYFEEDWGSGTPAYKGLNLSYYSTQVKGKDSWELNRLRLLGEVAEIVVYHQKDIVQRANEVVASFDEEKKQVYKQIKEVAAEIRNLEALVHGVKREQVLADLKSEQGISFNTRVDIKMKHNWTPGVHFIRLEDISKSGKKATAVYNIHKESATLQFEENIDVDKIVSQITFYTDNIVPASELV